MLGCHVAYVINASNRGDYSWHEYCVRYWLHLNFEKELQGVTWEQRLFTVMWCALTALALGEDVLVHCRQGKHRSGVVVMMLMTILAVAGSEDLSGVGSVQRPMVVGKGLTRVYYTRVDGDVGLLLGFTILGWMDAPW